MDEAMGRRTVSGLLLTKGGSILVFREESPRHKGTSCCTRLGCSSNLFLSKDRKMRKATKEAAIPQRSHEMLRNSNRVSPQGTNASDRSTRRSAAITCDETDKRPRRRENAGRDLLVRLKERVNASKKPPLSGGRSPNPSSPNTSSTDALSSSRSISRSICRSASRIRQDGGRNTEAVRMHRARDNSGRSREGVLTSRLRQGPIASLEDSLDESHRYWHFDVDESEEAENYYAFSDRHRGMRMDIEGLSYEELLALGERIGTVSTGLSDDMLSECLKRSLYAPTTSISHHDGDIKCIICQEEYFAGVEVAKMVCKHYYHTTCIQQWLRQKNWCPICKSIASAASS